MDLDSSDSETEQIYDDIVIDEAMNVTNIAPPKTKNPENK